LAYFRLEEFAHRAVWNDEAGRIEMHLVSQCRQTVHVDSMAVRLDAGEPIVTEHCHKYSLSQLRALAAQGGFRVEQVWQDRQQLFGVHLVCAG
jgi:L-histidine Nalpha-methyltransferase